MVVVSRCIDKILDEADSIKVLTPKEFAAMMQEAREAELLRDETDDDDDDEEEDDDDDEEADDEAATHYITGHELRCEAPAGYEEIWLAGGCFWCMEKCFMELDGVYVTATGYVGGEAASATYDAVCTGRTGHAEAVRVVYETTRLVDILKTFFEAHDPTTEDAQGNDRGSQYRSAIWFHSKRQKRICSSAIDTYSDACQDAGHGPVVTQLNSAKHSTFYYAEPEHQQTDAKPTAPNYYGLVPLDVDLDTSALLE